MTSDDLISDKRLMDIISEINKEDSRAKMAGEAHGNYGEEYGALAFDLVDARHERDTWKAKAINGEMVRAALIDLYLNTAKMSDPKTETRPFFISPYTGERLEAMLGLGRKK